MLTHAATPEQVELEAVVVVAGADTVVVVALVVVVVAALVVVTGAAVVVTGAAPRRLQVMGTPVPSSVLWPMASHAPMDKSRDSEFLQPGHMSATTAWMVMPLFTFVMESVLPHRDAS